MKRAAAVGSLLTLLALSGTAALHAAPNAGPASNDTNIVIDPAIAKASAEADAAAGTTSKNNHSEVAESPQTPYEKALLNYKSGKYEAAKVIIEQADQEKPGDVPIEMLKARILTELHDFTGAHQVLSSLYDRSDLTPAYAEALGLATGDLALRQHHNEAASKAYGNYLQAHPDDADTKLKLIYARLGAGDLVNASKYASELKPLDASTPAYYFARAALAHSNGEGDEEQDLEQARTIYGIHVTNRYLKTYLEVFSSDKKPVAGAHAPSATNAAPTGRAQ
jgi:predicted Zn-dependent protease